MAFSAFAMDGSMFISRTASHGLLNKPSTVFKSHTAATQRNTAMSARLDLSHPSLASATNTRIDTACRHMQQCRVSYEHMMNFVDSNEEKLQRDKTDYCVHKDELVLRAGCYLLQDRLQGFTRSAYPLVLSTMGTDVPSLLRFLYCLLYHNSDSVHSRHATKQVISKFVSGLPDAEDRMAASKMLFELLPFGVSTTQGFAHHKTGDTMTSLQIGGQITVMNGAYPIENGDYVQVYWDFEAPLFDKDGGRLPPLFELDWEAQPGKFRLTPTDPGVTPTMTEAEFVEFLRENYDLRAADPVQFADIRTRYRKAFYDREQGKKVLARLKSYKRNSRFVLYDAMRVFGMATSSARAYDPVDIQICRMPLWERFA